jgi:hypothetical protein
MYGVFVVPMYQTESSVFKKLTHELVREPWLKPWRESCLPKVLASFENLSCINHAGKDKNDYKFF